MTEQLTEEPGVQVGAVPTGPVRVAWAPVPKVNLLPVEIMEGRRFRRTQLLLGGAVLLTVLVGAGGVFWAKHGVDNANDQLLVAQARVTSLQAEQAKYAAVPAVIAQVDAADAARTLAMSTDVLWYRYLNDLDGAKPSGVELTGITIDMNSPSVPATATDVLTAAGLGSVKIDGTAGKYDQVAAWMVALNKIDGFSASALSTAADGSGGLTFNTSAVVDSDALSGRYEKEAG